MTHEQVEWEWLRCFFIWFFVSSRKLHSWESGGATRGERNSLLCVQWPQHQRQHSHVDTQLRTAASSQPVPPSQPVGKHKLLLLCAEATPHGFPLLFREVQSVWMAVNGFELNFPFLKQVSQITMRPSETRMYDLLRCTQEWTIPYSQIYVEGELCSTSTTVKQNIMYCSRLSHVQKNKDTIYVQF